ncbi:hypothetical protein H8S10_11460 [Clostridium sp. NSJ-49]|uniref:DUF4760 domain-containing protein n=1 Tax=Clostridium TaxID=1485 RepID=UPI00164A2939|nr:hypothetical protein [Clostridium sp. NSJ-49]MBC5626072.1 hypothetical protein [Clostridium sp. NSJ-49]
MSDFLEKGANFTTILGLFFVGYQIMMSKKEQRVQHEKQERMKAIELAELYANKLMSNISYLSRVYSEAKIEEEFKHIRYNELKEFDRDELKKMFNTKKIEEIDRKLNNISIDILIKSSIYLGDCVNDNKLNNYFEARECRFMSREVAAEVSATLDEKSKKSLNKILLKNKKKESYYDLHYQKLYTDTLNDTLNTLEYFCMYFNSGVADEETVYQSLHQSFLSMVKVLYFRIAYVNESGKDKYYTNIIELYNKWSDRYHLTEEKEIENRRKYTYKKEKVRR